MVTYKEKPHNGFKYVFCGANLCYYALYPRGTFKGVGATNSVCNYETIIIVHNRVDRDFSRQQIAFITGILYQ